MFVSTTQELDIPSGGLNPTGAIPSGIVEFQSNTVPPSPPLNLPHQNIEFPSLVNPIIARLEDVDNPFNITSYEFTVEGDYLVGFYGTTNDAGSNCFSIALWNGSTTITPMGAGIAATLTNFTLAFTAGTQGTEVKELTLIGIYHFTVGQKISLVNIGNSNAMLKSNVSDATTTAGITFQLLRAGTAVTGP